MKITETELEGVLIIEPNVFEDNRGYFMESYHKEKLSAHGIKIDFVQDNQSLSKQRGVLRGLHYQLNPKAQTKLVRVLTGAIFDVAVDLRSNSPTFGQWIGVVLSEENKKQLLIPKGFAHGFCTLEPNTLVFYKVDEHYSPEHDRGIAWNDPDLRIRWPISDPVLSSKDQRLPMLRHAEINF